MADFASLIAEVEHTRGVEASAIAVLSGVVARIEQAVADAIAANDAADLSAIQSAVTDLRTSSDALAAAIPANPEPQPEG